jgi:hypothetical protein
VKPNSSTRKTTTFNHPQDNYLQPPARQLPSSTRQDNCLRNLQFADILKGFLTCLQAKGLSSYQPRALALDGMGGIVLQTNGLPHKEGNKALNPMEPYASWSQLEALVRYIETQD